MSYTIVDDEGVLQVRASISMADTEEACDQRDEFVAKLMKALGVSEHGVELAAIKLREEEKSK